MNWSAKLLTAASLAIALGASAVAEEKAEKAAKRAATRAEKAALKAKKLPDLVIPIPTGHEAEGLRVPYFDSDGTLQMHFNIGSARRTDDDHLSMTDLRMETYDETGAPDMTIELPKSVLDLKTRIVTSETPVKITRSDFELTGETMMFNTQTRRGKLIGSVRMLIYNSDSFTKNDGETVQ